MSPSSRSPKAQRERSPSPGTERTGHPGWSTCTILLRHENRHHVDQLPYLLTFGTYGSRLHGDRRGSWEPKATGSAPLMRDDFRRGFEQREMAQPPFVIKANARPVIERTILEVCANRGWMMLAINVRMEHVHVVAAAEVSPDDVVLTFKSYSTRRLREAGVVAADRKVWARHQSAKHLLEEGSVAAAVDYVVHRQGRRLPGSIFGDGMEAE